MQTVSAQQTAAYDSITCGQPVEAHPCEETDAWEENRGQRRECPCNLSRDELLELKAILVDADGLCTAASVYDYKTCGQPVEAHPWEYNSKSQSEILDFYGVEFYFLFSYFRSVGIFGE
jgi:hypothetical protein